MEKTPSKFIAFETAFSFVALYGVFHLFLNALGTYWCVSGECEPPNPASIWTFRALATLTVTAVIGTFAFARHRRARWSWLWHGVVGLAAAVAVVTFSVPEIDLHDLMTPDHESSRPIHPTCLSPGPECDKLGG